MGWTHQAPCFALCLLLILGKGGGARHVRAFIIAQDEGQEAVFCVLPHLRLGAFVHTVFSRELPSKIYRERRRWHGHLSLLDAQDLLNKGDVRLEDFRLNTPSCVCRVH